MRTIGLVPSNNGFGHLRRLISLVPALQDAGYKVSIIWDKRIRFPGELLGIRDQLEINFISTPLDLDGPYVKAQEKSCDEIDLHNSLKPYDLVIADTVTWPLRCHTNAVLIAQFTWEHYYRKRNSIDANQWEEKVKSIPQDSRIFSMQLFQWGDMLDFPGVTPIPILDYWGLRERLISRNQRIGVIRSGVARWMNQPNPTSDLLKNNQIDLIQGLENYASQKGSVPAGIICRAGLGAISECISAKSLPILLEDADIEIQYNRQILLDLGLAIDFKNLKNFGDKRLLQIEQLASSMIWPDVLSAQDLTEQILKGN